MRTIASWILALGVLGVLGAVVCFVADVALLGPVLLLLGLLGLAVGGGLRVAFMRGASSGTGGDGAFGGGGL